LAAGDGSGAVIELSEPNAVGAGLVDGAEVEPDGVPADAAAGGGADRGVRGMVFPRTLESGGDAGRGVVAPAPPDAVGLDGGAVVAGLVDFGSGSVPLIAFAPVDRSGGSS
jgi:hypothetical protein